MFQNSREQSGFTLFELMVTIGLSSFVFLAIMQTYTTMTSLAHDHKVRLETAVQAQAIMQTIGAEIRVLGNGVPFDQPNFEIGETALSDPTVTEPILINSSDTSTISFRLNESGRVSLLTSDFNPAVDSTIALTDVSDYATNDPFYISNSVMSGKDGFYAVISGVNHLTKTVTFNAATAQYSPGATFIMGSIFEEVPIITVANSASGITRNSGYGTILLGKNSTVTFEYRDYDGNVLTPPLTNLDVVDLLRAIKVTVQYSSTSKLKTGNYYTTTISQVYGLRNLNYVY